jgi:hypothetical protein
MNCPNNTYNCCNSCCSTPCGCKKTTTTTSTTTQSFNCEADNCEEVIDLQCVKHTGADSACLNIYYGNSLESVLAMLFRNATLLDCYKNICFVSSPEAGAFVYQYEIGSELYNNFNYYIVQEVFIEWYNNTYIYWNSAQNRWEWGKNLGNNSEASETLIAFLTDTNLEPGYPANEIDVLAWEMSPLTYDPITGKGGYIQDFTSKIEELPCIINPITIA